jgi:hypothetical protein
LEAENNKIPDDGFEYFDPVHEGVEDNLRVVHGIEGAQERAIVCPFVVGGLEGERFSMESIYFGLHGAGNADLDVDVPLAIGLHCGADTSNMYSFALMWCLAGSLTLYLDDMNELKWAVVGNMSPLI